MASRPHKQLPVTGAPALIASQYERTDAIGDCRRRHATAHHGRRVGVDGKLYDYIATGGFEARFKTIEQGSDRLRQELAQDQRVSQHRWKRMEQIMDEFLEQGLQGIVLDIIGLGGEIPPVGPRRASRRRSPELPPT